MNSIGLKRLVSEDDDYLMELALNKIVENFIFLARSVAKLGKRCEDPSYHRFEQFVNDTIHNGFQWARWEYRGKKMLSIGEMIPNSIISFSYLWEPSWSTTLAKIMNAESVKPSNFKMVSITANR